MNKPAPKEPSMDEILSSIRQIIADDDAGSATRKAIVPPQWPLSPVLQSFAPPGVRPLSLAAIRDAEPLALSTEQIVREPEAPLVSDVATATVDPADISLEEDADDEEEQDVAEPPMTYVPRSFAPSPPFEPAVAPPRPATSVSQAAPMPDATLSSDLADQLLEPTTQSAVQSNFAKLTSFSTVGTGVTIEAMMREMLRPMLKEWLDENLPAVVERLVEQEISRVSRGTR